MTMLISSSFAVAGFLTSMEATYDYLASSLPTAESSLPWFIPRQHDQPSKSWNDGSIFLKKVLMHLAAFLTILEGRRIQLIRRSLDGKANWKASRDSGSFTILFRSDVWYVTCPSSRASARGLCVGVRFHQGVNFVLPVHGLCWMNLEGIGRPWKSLCGEDRLLYPWQQRHNSGDLRIH